MRRQNLRRCSRTSKRQITSAESHHLMSSHSVQLMQRVCRLPADRQQGASHSPVLAARLRFLTDAGWNPSESLIQAKPAVDGVSASHAAAGNADTPNRAMISPIPTSQARERNAARSAR